MKQLIVFLGLVGASIYALLDVTHRLIPVIPEDNKATGQTRLSAWGPYLPDPSLSQNLATRQQLSPSQKEVVYWWGDPSQNSERPRDWAYSSIDGAEQGPIGGVRLAERVHSAPSVTFPKAQPDAAPDNLQTDTFPREDGSQSSSSITDAAFETSVPSGEEAIWFVVSRAARLHTGPSVASLVVHLYPVGTELKLIGYEQGWLLVWDPATSRQGWIYEHYYLEAIPGPGQTQVAVHQSPRPARVALAAPKPKPVSRVKKPRPPQQITQPRPRQKIAKSKSQQRIRVASSQDESVYSLMQKAFRQ